MRRAVQSTRVNAIEHRKITAKEMVWAFFLAHPRETVTPSDVRAWVEERLGNRWADIATVMSDSVIRDGSEFGGCSTGYPNEERYLTRPAPGHYRLHPMVLGTLDARMPRRD